MYPSRARSYFGLNDHERRLDGAKLWLQLHESRLDRRHEIVQKVHRIYGKVVDEGDHAFLIDRRYLEQIAGKKNGHKLIGNIRADSVMRRLSGSRQN